MFDAHTDNNIHVMCVEMRLIIYIILNDICERQDASEDVVRDVARDDINADQVNHYELHDDHYELHDA